MSAVVVAWSEMRNSWLPRDHDVQGQAKALRAQSLKVRAEADALEERVQKLRAKADRLMSEADERASRLPRPVRP